MRFQLRILCAWLLLALAPLAAQACSCAWLGPFLAVADQSPLIVHGRILRHHTQPAPSMDVLVLETLKGGLLDSGLRVAMGDGMHCRPSIEGFPPGSEWVLALNGAGAKPGTGLALSHCGAYWLQVNDGVASGNIVTGASADQRMSIDELKMRLRQPAYDVRFAGSVRKGETFRRSFAGRFEFVLEPHPQGWEIVIRANGEEDNLARLTPPLHAMPNPREIDGWHFLADPSTCRSRPYAADAGPAEPRRFIFSPQVKKVVGRAATPADLATIERHGRGTLTIEHVALDEANAEGCPAIHTLRFSVHLAGGE